MEQVVAVRNRARFVVPQVDPGIVVRSRLDSRYESATGQVVRVLAPAGYGKTTIVSRWMAAEPRAVAWVDLERVDNDPFVLVGTVAQALSDICDLPETSLPSAPLAARGLAESLAPRFGALLGRCTTPFVLVLDDLHAIDTAAASAIIDALADHLPPACTLVLAGRAHHLDAAVGRLRLSPGLVDVTAQDLALDLTESEQMMAGLGVRLAPAEVARLAEHFEGWPAGLRLAGQALARSDSEAPVGVAEVAADGFVRAYLRAEWEGHLSDDDTRFLREAACLRRFTAEMCDTVLERPDSGVRLERLHRDELLVMPLDQRAQWHRMHPLLAGHLEAELQDRDRPRWREIHVNAARWWEQHGDIDLALDHARLSGDLDMCQALVAAHGGAYFTLGLHATVRRWLGEFPPSTVRTSAPLCSIGVLDALHLGDGPRALRWSRLLLEIVEDHDRPLAQDDEIRLRSDAVRAVLEVRPAAELLPLAERASVGLPVGPWKGMARLALGGLLFMTGDARAADAFDEGAFEAELATSPLLQAHCLAAHAIVADLEGDRAHAALLGRHAGELVRSRRSELVPTTALVASVQALLEARAGRREAAFKELTLARRHLAGYREIAPWFNILARLALVKATVLLGDRPVSRQLLREIDQHLESQSPDNPAAAQVAALKATVEAAERLLPDGPWTLTAAEFRVLEHLPTSLSLADIAQRLFVTRNTVKTHAAGIYRKLGATSRNEAVDLAREAGVLDDRQQED